MIIDNVLGLIGMGRYQWTRGLLFGLTILYANLLTPMYIFTASDLKYRCVIPECDAIDPNKQIYEPEWLRFTTPYREESERPMKCQRYDVSASSVYGSQCAPNKFDRNKTVWCHGNWVFEDTEKTIGTEFGLMCEENKWKLSIVGSVDSLGQFIGIPIMGIVSDKFGRKFSMVIGTVVASIINIIKSFSTSYLMYMVLELCSSTVFSGVYVATFTLAMEFMLPKKRVLYISILDSFYSIGSILLGSIASQVKDWRLLLRITNIPGLIFLSYYWLLEESLRWLEVNGKHDKVIVALKKIARINNKLLPDDLLSNEHCKNGDERIITQTSILKEIFRSSTLFWRMIRCSLVWIGTNLVYYGLNVSATDIAGNKYLNFILNTSVEIPACMLYWIIAETMPRKIALFSMYILSGVTCVLYNLTSKSLGFVPMLIVFMISKLAISIAFNIIYLQTAEIFPTTMRATMLSLCSTFGQIGSMLAPQIPLIAEYFGEYVAMLVMGVMALAAAAITLILPESRNLKLPDSVEEAERITNTETN